MLEYLAAHFAGCLAADAVRFKQEEKAAVAAQAELEGKWDFATSEMIVDPVPAPDLLAIREHVRSIASACSILDDMDFCEGVGLLGMTFRGIFLDDAIKFMLCAAMADGELNADEAVTIGIIMDDSRDVAYWMGEAASLCAIGGSYHFEKPLFFEIACRMGDFLGADLAGTARLLYEKLGCAVIQADGRVSQGEIDAIESCLDAIDYWAM
ncbi:MAG: hypothetical protein IKV48_00935 [Eggerthellaceae bacterium]|nr:hypothetical protein [Eggerthellaceae bacterium]